MSFPWVPLQRRIFQLLPDEQLMPSFHSLSKQKFKNNSICAIKLKTQNEKRLRNLNLSFVPKSTTETLSEHSNTFSV